MSHRAPRAEIVELQRVLDEVGKGNLTLERCAPYVEATCEAVQALIDAAGQCDDTGLIYRDDSVAR